MSVNDEGYEPRFSEQDDACRLLTQADDVLESAANFHDMVAV